MAHGGERPPGEGEALFRWCVDLIGLVAGGMVVLVGGILVLAGCLGLAQAAYGGPWRQDPPFAAEFGAVVGGFLLLAAGALVLRPAACDVWDLLRARPVSLAMLLLTVTLIGFGIGAGIWLGR